MSLRGDFAGVQSTKFWEQYRKLILAERTTLLRNLEMGKIDKPCTQGAAWQVGLRLVNGILSFPDKVIAEDEDIDNTSG